MPPPPTPAGSLSDQGGIVVSQDESESQFEIFFVIAIILYPMNVYLYQKLFI